MIDLKAIQNQINQLKTRKKFTLRGEIPKLTNILWNTEKIEKIIEAANEDGFSPGIIVLTNQRFISILKFCLTDSSKFFAQKRCMIEVEVFLYKDIFDVYRQGPGKITIETIQSNRRFNFLLVDRSKDQAFCDYIDSKLLSVNK